MAHGPALREPKHMPRHWKNYRPKPKKKLVLYHKMFGRKLRRVRIIKKTFKVIKKLQLTSYRDWVLILLSNKIRKLT